MRWHQSASKIYREHLHILAADLRFGARTLINSPGFTLVALLAIALGIGATTAVFSLVNAVLIRSLPYRDAERLVYLWSPNSRFKGQMVPDELAPSYPDFYDWQRLSHSFSALTMFNQRMLNLVGSGIVRRVGSALVTGNFFQTLDAKPELGRTIDRFDDQPGHQHVAVISDALWQERFAGDPSVIGKVLQLNRDKYTVIGVMPDEFGYPHEGDVPFGMSKFRRTEVWIPLVLTTAQKSDRARLDSGDAAVGRLKPGVSVKQAEAELSNIESRLNALYPAEWKGWTASVKPFVGTIVGAVGKMLWLLLSAVGLVLLIACSNVANLLMARVSARVHEMGVRVALGAERARLVRQMLTESLLLCSVGGLIGVLLAFSAVRVLVRLNPGNIPRFDETSVDGRVLLVSIAASLVTGLLAGLVPALSASRVNVSELLKQGGNKGVAGTSNRWRNSLIVTEVVLSVVLLAGAGLLIRSYLQVEAVDPGFTRSALTFRLPLNARYSTPQQRIAFYQKFTEQAKNLPGVRAVGAVSSLPLSHDESASFLEVKGYEIRKNELVDSRSATPGYFHAIGVPLMRGRYFDDRDLNSRSLVALVNESFAKAYLRGSDPLGKQLRLGMGDGSGPWSTVIGVVSDIRHTTLEGKARPEVFQPSWLGTYPEANFAIQSNVQPERLVSSLRRVLRDMDSNLAFEDVRTMSQRVLEATALRRFQTILLSAFAGLAVFLACVGLYGLISYSVRQRTAELGIRMALGASRAQVLVMVLRQGIGLVALGLVGGIGIGLALTRLLAGWLYGVSATDPVTFVAVPVLILLVATVACLFPGWKATRIDPVNALRYE